MVHGVMVVRRYCRGLDMMAWRPIVRPGGGVRQLQAGLPRRTAGDERNRNGPDQHVANDPTHRRMLADENAESHWTADCVRNVAESCPRQIGR
jgi:hypothetical protein